MRATRRSFLAHSIGTFAAAGSALPAAAEADEQDQDDEHDPARPLDYGRSFLCNPAAFNAVRFWIESRTTVFDDQSGDATPFYQCASCKSEHTFAEKSLFHKDNYDFLPIFGGGDWLIFRRPARLSDRYREVRKAEQIWGTPILKLRPGRHVTELHSWESIRDTTAAAIPIVGQTEIGNSDTGLRAIIECPVKTMNVSLENQLYQVDTGPVALPDLSKRYEKPIESLSLAFLAFNTPGFADFVLEQPTPVMDGDRELAKVYHYSGPFSLPAKNRLLAVGSVE